MKVIGITGGTGAGKSTVCAELARLGAETADADKIAHEVSDPGGAAYAELVREFGSGILCDGGRIDRKKLGRIVFSDREKLKKLNEVTHKYVYAELQRRIDGCRADVIALDVPLLFEKGSPIRYDLTVAVTADSETRLARIMARDGIDHDAALARMKNQMTDSEYARLADLCVENGADADAAQLAARIMQAVQTK